MNIPRTSPTRRRAGFTLVELLTVMAIIAILAAILVPTTSIAMKKVKEAKTRVQLNNLVSMCTFYFEQYKVWPTLNATPDHSVDTKLSLKENAPRFVHVMTGSPDEPDRPFNKLKIPFATFNDSDLSTDPDTVTPLDAFQNDDLYLVYNTNISTLHHISPDVVNGITMTGKDGDKTVSVTQNAQILINADCVALSPGAGTNDNDANDVATWNVQIDAN